MRSLRIADPIEPAREAWYPAAHWGDALLRFAVLFTIALIALVLVPGASAETPADSDRFDVVVIDAGHGGHDEGALGRSGLREKDLVLDVARRLAKRLRDSDSKSC